MESRTCGKCSIKFTSFIRFQYNYHYFFLVKPLVKLTEPRINVEPICGEIHFYYVFR